MSGPTFQIGDRVRVISASCYQGRSGIIQSCNARWGCMVKIAGDHDFEEVSFAARELEMENTQGQQPEGSPR